MSILARANLYMPSSYLRCSSARILLARHRQCCERSVETLDNGQENEIIRCGIAFDIVRLSQSVTSESGQLLDEVICPFPLNAAYHAAIAYLEMNIKKEIEEYLQGLWQTKSLLALCSQRWKLGGKSYSTFYQQSR